jgi:Tol biopolymer transport system component
VLARRLPIPAVALLSSVALVAACNGPAVTPAASAGASGGQPSAAPSTSAAPPSASAPLATLGPSVAPSTAGRIVFTRLDATGHHELYSVAADGTDLQPILQNYSIGFSLPRWDPTGLLLAAVSGDKADGLAQNGSDEDRGFETVVQPDRKSHLHLQPPTATIRLVCTTWSADARRFACEGWTTTAGHEGVYTVSSADGSGLTRLTTPPSGIRDIPADFSVAGTKLVFVRATYAVLGLGQIWMAGADGSDAHKITDTLSTYQVSWSRDGRWIVGERNGALEVIDLQHLGADPTLLEIPDGTATQPRWSPDGSRIVFVFTKTGSKTSQVATVNPDGSGLVLVTSGSVDLAPDWGVPGF